jgi:hypothetical protein
MKGSDFIKVLRKVIREEVRTVVKEELKAIKPIIAERQVTPVQPRREQPKPKREYPLVALNGPLASILKETADSMYNNQEEWPDMNDGPLTTEHAQARSPRQSMVSMDPSDPTTAFIKDYSAVMKAADAIQQGRS